MVTEVDEFRIAATTAGSVLVPKGSRAVEGVVPAAAAASAPALIVGRKATFSAQSKVP